MILKSKDDLAPQLAALEKLRSIRTLTPRQQEDIEEEIFAIKAGAKGEKEAAYHIDFSWKDSKHSIVIHDLRLEHDGRVAQIDHIILSRTLFCHVIESKGFSREVRILENGEWETRTRFGWRGIPSPIEQNKRHISVLEAFLKNSGVLPTRLGFTLPIRFENWVLVAPSCQIRRKKDEWSQVVKMDMFRTRMDQENDSMGVTDVLGAATRFCSLETVEVIAQKLVSAHKPGSFNFAAKFGITPEQDQERFAPLQVLSPVEAPVSISAPPPLPLDVCYSCSTPVEPKVARYCRMNSKKFGGRVLCQPCQKTNASKLRCDACIAELEDKVVAFCRFNSKRFGGKLLCRTCQSGVVSG